MQVRAALFFSCILAAGCFSPSPRVNLGCSESERCPDGQSCILDTCVVVDCSEEQPCPEGSCINGACVTSDCEDLECSDFEVCVAGACVDAQCTGVCGDANQDGLTDVADLVLTQDSLDSGELASPCQLVDTDLDSDGVITERDARLLGATLGSGVIGICETTCTESCGDVNGDGDVDSGDIGRSIIIVAEPQVPTVCEFLAADTDGDGMLTEADIELISPLSFGTATGGCTPCELACGDVNGGGTVEILDVSLAREYVDDVTVPTLCQFVAADANSDLELTERDIRLLDQSAQQEVVPICEDCINRCGDANQDGEISILDASAIVAIANGNNETPTFCEYDAGDINSDGRVSVRDANLISRALVDSVTLPAADVCGECTGICGDVNQDGSVALADASLAEAYRAGMQLPTNPCAWDAADLNGDGDIEESEPEDILNAAQGLGTITCTEP
jgi:hypothetical protein